MLRIQPFHPTTLIHWWREKMAPILQTKYLKLFYWITSLMQKNPLYCNDHTITEFGIIDNKNSITAYVILYELVDTWFFDSNRRVGVWSLPWRWHILSIPLTTGGGTRAESCGLDDVFPPDNLCWHMQSYISWFIISFFGFIFTS